MSILFGPRRAIYTNIIEEKWPALSGEEIELFEWLDLLYRSVCALLYNYVPTSGHPGGSISSGRIVEALLFDSMDYEMASPDRTDADLISYSAGHKAMGLYALWALRNEILRVAVPELLAPDERNQLRLEDLIGFRRNPITATPLFSRFRVKALDGHPTPATPFVRLSTGASGVGVASSLGLAVAAADLYRDDPPRVHLIEGEGGLTPGRVAEALAFAGTAGLRNALVHVDWNQSSIDSDRVTREDDQPGDYVQWDPRELFHLHDWNVIYVPDGHDFNQVVGAQRTALSLHSQQPTAIIYRTTKGWRYGVEGRASHGAGHQLCSVAFFEALRPLTRASVEELPHCDAGENRCAAGIDARVVENCLWDALLVVRRMIEGERGKAEALAMRLIASKERLDARGRRVHEQAPRIDRIYEAARDSAVVPSQLRLEPWTTTTLRAQLGKVLHHMNVQSGGALMIASADLLGSTSIAEATRGLAGGYWNMASRPESRTLATGGICEDAMTGILAGLSSFGSHLGVGSSYGAFIAPLGHIAARLHAIGNQARAAVSGAPFTPFVMICGHAGLKTGEDGPTHADPQPLQLLQENFPGGTLITLTPWDPNEIWPLMTEALDRRPAIIVPFVTRPSETVIDRELMGLAPAEHARRGVYRLRAANRASDGTIVLQESGVAYEFIQGALRLLEQDGIDLDVYYVASAELFDRLMPIEREGIYPEELAMEAMGITGFTMPTMYRWIRSDFGRAHSLHPYRSGKYPGSGAGHAVLTEAELDGGSQHRAILRYVEERRKGQTRKARRKTTSAPADLRG